MKYLLTIILFVCCNAIFSQNSYSIKAFAIGVHPFSELNTDILTNKLGSNDLLAFEPGLILASEFFLNSDMVSIKPMQSIYLDRMGQIAGFTHLGLRAYVYKKKKHSLVLGIGSSLFYRQDWSGIENYIDEDIYEIKKGFQYKFFMLSGEIEYNYYLSKLNYFTLSANHIDLQAFTASVGFKRLFKYRKKKKKRKACDCPSYR